MKPWIWRYRAPIAAAALLLLASYTPSRSALASCAVAPTPPDGLNFIQRIAAEGGVAFVGTVVSTDSGDRLAHVRVEQIWVGPDLPQTVEVRGGPGSLASNEASSVDRRYDSGRRYLFVPTNNSPPFEDNSCTATTPYTPSIGQFAPSGARGPLLDSSSPTQDAASIARSLVSPISAVTYAAGGIALAAVVVAGLGAMLRSRHGH